MVAGSRGVVATQLAERHDALSQALVLGSSYSLGEDGLASAAHLRCLRSSEREGRQQVLQGRLEHAAQKSCMQKLEISRLLMQVQQLKDVGSERSSAACRRDLFLPGCKSTVDIAVPAVFCHHSLAVASLCGLLRGRARPAQACVCSCDSSQKASRHPRCLAHD